MGRIIIIVGVVLVVVGLLINVGVPIGRLPGDVTYKRGNVSVYFPLTTSIVASVLLNLLFWFLRRP